MTPQLTLVALPENTSAADRLARLLNAGICPFQTHVFPDEEVAVGFARKPGDDVALVCTLDRPNPKFLPLIFAAKTARELGARRVGLIAPYLAYMRQDSRFSEGGAVSARLFADEISNAFDWMVTVDPHLHRVHDLEEIFDIPCEVAHAAPAMAAWIRLNVTDPVIIGPDEESRQWVEQIAQLCEAPFVTLRKQRFSDDRVALSLDQAVPARKRPVLIDDILSTASTMVKAVEVSRSVFEIPPVCAAVHAVFTPGAYDRLIAAGPLAVVTTNTIAHSSNDIDVFDAVASSVQRITGTRKTA